MQDDDLKVQSAYGFEYNIKIAGIGARSYAYTIDWHIRVLGALAWILLAMLIAFLIEGLGSDTEAYGWFLFLPAAAIYFLYHPVLELAMQGNTPGKKYAKVRVLTKEGGIPTPTAILVRNVMRVLDSLPLFYVIGIVCCVVTRQQVRVGDLAAGTLLVYHQEEGSVSEEVEETDSADLSIREREVIKKLLDRWDDLTVETRSELGVKALEKFGRPTSVADIRAELESILS